jgi:hypothetical protein
VVAAVASLLGRIASLQIALERSASHLLASHQFAR